MNPPYPLERLRSDVPAMNRRIEGRIPAYFDGPGGTQVPRTVIEAVTTYLTRHNANTHGAFATSRESDRILAEAREAMADFTGAGSTSEIVFGANMTTLTFAVSRALGRHWDEGDELIVTQLDHQANIAPWRLLAEDRGLEVRTIPVDAHTLALDLAALEELLSARTRLVAVGAASNAVGTITDVRRVADLAHSVGALCFVDAVHFAAHRRIDVAALGCDFLACSAYKFFGPHLGVLWGRLGLLEEFTPYKVPPAPNTPPHSWETGTLNHEGIAGSAAAVDWIAGVGARADAVGDRRGDLDQAWERIGRHEGELLHQLLEGLGEIPSVRVHGPQPGAARTPTVALTVDGYSAERVAERLAAEAIFVWSGDFYAPNVIERLGLTERGGVVRIGIAAYTSADDTERLLAALARFTNGA